MVKFKQPDSKVLLLYEKDEKIKIKPDIHTKSKEQPLVETSNNGLCPHRRRRDVSQTYTVKQFDKRSLKTETLWGLDSIFDYQTIPFHNDYNSPLVFFTKVTDMLRNFPSEHLQ